MGAQFLNPRSIVYNPRPDPRLLLNPKAAKSKSSHDESQGSKHSASLSQVDHRESTFPYVSPASGSRANESPSPYLSPPHTNSSSPYFRHNLTPSPGQFQEDAVAEMNVSDQHAHPSLPRSTALLEGVYGPESRSDQPQKKVKRNIDDTSEFRKSHTAFSHRGNEGMGEYLKPEPGAAKNAQINPMVDLTQGRWFCPCTIAPQTEAKCRRRRRCHHRRGQCK